MKKILALPLSALMFVAVEAQARSSFSLGTSSNPLLSTVVTFLQDIVDFIASPYALFISFCGFSFAITMYIFKPKEMADAIAWGVRIGIGAIFFFGLGTFINWLQQL